MGMKRKLLAAAAVLTMWGTVLGAAPLTVQAAPAAVILPAGNVNAQIAQYQQALASQQQVLAAQQAAAAQAQATLDNLNLQLAQLDAQRQIVAAAIEQAEAALYQQQAALSAQQAAVSAQEGALQLALGQINVQNQAAVDAVNGVPVIDTAMILKVQSYLNAYQIPCAMTGVYDTQTAQALLQFQTKYGLVADGQINLQILRTFGLA